ncbi:MAG TPA: deoxyhypusine synthase family protein, partial [archaeon]|nr:deoxyhypusine synthase family protein [archaeon]
MPYPCGGPFESKYMGEGSRAQVPLRLTDEFIAATTYVVGTVDRNLGYQAEQKFAAGERWVRAKEKGEYVWLSIAGAATPVGMGGLIADLIERGLVDAIVSTGANVYHDLHFACGLPVRHGSAQVDDDDMRADGTTRIYTQLIHNTYTLKLQDMVNQIIGRRIAGRLPQRFSTAQLISEFGRELLDDTSGLLVDREGSMVVRAAEYGVPIFLDSGANHSFGMDLALLAEEGLHVDTSPSEDVVQAAALSVFTQPQLNVFLGEGGPRNFTQTTAPTASEIFHIPFDGSAGCIMFTTADPRTGGLSGSTQSEAVTWGKYLDANPDREVLVWGEYTLTAPQVMGYVAGKAGRAEPRRLMDRLPRIAADFREQIQAHRPELDADQ